jgi:hypothetical protein
LAESIIPHLQFGSYLICLICSVRQCAFEKWKEVQRLP